MLTERLYSYLVVLWLTSVALGQAPGDHNVLCRTGDNHIFSTEWRILVDTFDYQNLFNPVLISPVWLAESFGGTGNWIQNLGGSCSWQMRVCESSAGQDNWLFSQYISYEDAIEVFFNVSYRFVECRPENGCTKNYVTVYGYNRNGISDTERVITGNYEPLFGSAESSRLQQSGTFTDTETLSFTRSTNSDGLYLGLRDEGTCGNVIRIIMYYVVCPGRVVDLVTYPETAVPVVGSSDITFVAMCASNAHSITSLEVTASSSTSTCTDVAPGGAACECDEGYMLSGDGRSCGACNAGTYRTSSDNSCRSCPGNTELNVVAASECSCLAGFYRTPQEGPEIQCTEPPSEIRNLEVMSSIDTTITIRWMIPSTTGRSDFFYRVSYSDPDNIGNFISSDDNIMNIQSTVTYEVTGLVPFTPYILRVTPHNGVSDQDSNPPISEISAATMEGIPGQPINVQSLCTVVVWQAPTDPNGNIIGYEVDFSPGVTRDLGPADTFYLTTNTESNSDTQVRVRASTIAGPGQWTSMINVGCSSGDGNCPDVCTTSQVTCPVCPTLLPRVCPTCPTVTSAPPPTCPICPTSLTCSTCSTITTAPPLTCPTCPTTSTTSGLRFELNGITYLNNTVVDLDDIGIDEAALLCITDNTGCCNTIIRKGEFFYPNGSTVPNNAAGNTFYRNRGDQLIRLHKRNNAQAPSGQYSCQIPDASGIDQTIYINISDVSTSSLLPPSSVLDMIEVSNFFVGALNSPAISDSMELVFDDFSNKRRAAGTTTVEIEVVLGSLLIVVPKDKLASLTKGNSYNIQIKAATESSPFSFQYTEEIPQKMASTGNNNLVIYIVATAIVSIVLTSIVAATIMICIALYLRKKYKSGAVNDLLTKYNKNEYVPNSTEMNNKEEIK